MDMDLVLGDCKCAHTQSAKREPASSHRRLWIYTLASLSAHMACAAAIIWQLVTLRDAGLVILFFTDYRHNLHKRVNVTAL